LDPNENLKRQRWLAAEIVAETDRLARIIEQGDDYCDAEGIEERLRVYAGDLAELVQALDEWRLKGGFDPYANLETEHER